MKKIFLILILIISQGLFAQKQIVEAVGFSESDATEKAYLVTIDNTLRWIVYDEVNNQFEYYDGTNWVGIGGTPDLSNYVTLDGNETITGIKIHKEDIILQNNDNSEITTVSSDGISFFYDGGVLSGTKKISFGQSSPVSANFTLPAFGGDLLTKALTDTYYVSKEGFLVTGTDAGGNLFIRIGSATEPNIIIDQSAPNAYFTGDWIFADGRLSLFNGTYDNSIRNTNTTSNAIYELPDKALGTYTLATTEDATATPNYDINELTGDTTITSAMNGQLLQYKGTDTIVATIPDNATLGLTNEEAAGFNVSFYVPKDSEGRVKVAYSGDAGGDYVVLVPAGYHTTAQVVQDSINKYVAFGNWQEYTYTPPTSATLIDRFDYTDVVTTTSTDPTIFTGLNGKQQLSFDGVDDFYNWGQIANLVPQVDEFTIVVKIGDTWDDRDAPVISQGSSFTSSSFYIANKNTNWYASAGGTYNNNVVTVQANDLFVITVSTTTSTVYLNGVLLATDPVGADDFSTTDIIVGNRSTMSYPYGGDLEFIELHNKVLDAGELAAINALHNEN